MSAARIVRGHGVLFIMQFTTAVSTGSQMPMDISSVLCFISYPFRIRIDIRRI